MNEGEDRQNLSLPLDCCTAHGRLCSCACVCARVCVHVRVHARVPVSSPLFLVQRVGRPLTVAGAVLGAGNAGVSAAVEVPLFPELAFPLL